MPAASAEAHLERKCCQVTGRQGLLRGQACEATATDRQLLGQAVHQGQLDTCSSHAVSGRSLCHNELLKDGTQAHYPPLSMILSAKWGGLTDGYSGNWCCTGTGHLLG